jgi:hypothetical protein
MPEHLYGTPITTQRDNLFSDIGPAPKVEIKTIAGLTAAATYKRGTVFSQDAATGKLFIAGTTPTPPVIDGQTVVTPGQILTPDCVLCDNETTEAATDKTVSVYVTGRYNQYALAWKDGYSPTLADKNALRDKNILLAADFD